MRAFPIASTVLVVLLASVDAFTAACVKMPSSDGKGVQYHARIPQGKQYADSHDMLPCKPFRDELKDCNMERFECVYDTEGNAHMDFVLKSRGRMGIFRNKCDVAAHIQDVTQTDIECKVGTAASLADQWNS